MATNIANLKCLRQRLALKAAFGVIIFLSSIPYFMDNNHSSDVGYFRYEPNAHAKLSVPQFDSGPVMLDPKLRVEVFFRDLNFPTSMAFLSADDLFVLEKNEGTVKRIVNGVMLKDPLLKVNVSSAGERGMLGIAAIKHDNVSRPAYIFLYFTEVITKENEFGGEDGNRSSLASNRLYRYELINDKLVNPKLIFQILPSNHTIHNGGTVVVGPDENVYLVIGDMLGGDPQKEDLQNGRAGILRFTQEGNTVKNDTVKGILGNTHPLNKYYAYGIRNSFGMDFDPLTGKLWDTENGPGFGDEINLVEPGFNSGWEMVHGFWGVKFPNSNTTILDPVDLLDIGKLKYSSPKFAAIPTVGLTALTFLDSINYGKEYENDIIVGDFHNGFLYHLGLNEERTELDLKGDVRDKVAKTTKELNEILIGQGFGGVTDIKVGPDGNIYVLAIYQGGDNCNSITMTKCIEYTSSIAGAIFRILPVNNSLIAEKEQR